MKPKRKKGSFSYRGVKNIYEGEYISNYVPHGKGKITFPNNDNYEGGWILGLATGKGVMIGHDFNGKSYKYEGDFVNFQMQGQGTFFYANGDSYSGEFQRNLFHGHGIYKWKNGDSFKGVWDKGLRNGQGKFL